MVASEGHAPPPKPTTCEIKIKNEENIGLRDVKYIHGYIWIYRHYT